MRTLDDLVKQYHMSRMTFQRRMAIIPDFKSKFCKRGKYNKLLISDKGVSLINYEKHDSTSKAFHTKHGNNSGQLNKADLVDIIHYLRDDLKKKDSQIITLKNSKNKQIRLSYHNQGLPTPEEWRLQSEVNKQQHDYIKNLKSSINNMSFSDWLKNRFGK